MASSVRLPQLPVYSLQAGGPGVRAEPATATPAPQLARRTQGLPSTAHTPVLPMVMGHSSSDGQHWTLWAGPSQPRVLGSEDGHSWALTSEHWILGRDPSSTPQPRRAP